MSKYIHVLVLLLGVGLAAAWWFMVKPTQEVQLDNLEHQIRQAETLYQQNAAAYAVASTYLPGLKALFAETQTAFNAITSTFSDEDYQPNLLDFINNLALRHSLSVTSITETERVQVYPDVIGVIYEIDTTGRFQDQLDLFTSIQHNRVRTTILSTSISITSGTNPRAPQLKTSTEFQTYVAGTLPEEDEDELASGGKK